jgi:putative ABC transport system ATP-binding protein
MIIHTKNLKKSFMNGKTETQILKGIDLDVERGEFISIMGRSGAGKSTFMYQISLLDTPTSGEISIDGRDPATMTNDEKTAFRLQKLGYVFQDYALIPELSALENVALPLLMQNLPPTTAYDKATDALAKVGLADHLHQLPSQLSGGEQQRVSISRAIGHSPDILFADEPTANLDNESSKTIMNIFEQLHREGQTIIMVTHEPEYGERAQKIIKLDDGMIVNIIRTNHES